ncbi:unnamed protein product, partial [marine sediment metagenome]
NVLREEMMANMSHDLRTPCGLYNGFLYTK